MKPDSRFFMKFHKIIDCVFPIYKKFLRCPQSKMSYHLKLLLSSKIITKHNQAQWSFYEVNHEEIKKLVSPAVYEMLIKRAVESK